jgi:hypothetical protein
MVATKPANKALQAAAESVVRADFHWLGGRRVKLNSRSPASSRLLVTAGHFDRLLRRKARRCFSMSATSSA